MATVKEIRVIDAPFQTLETVMGGKAVRLRLAHNTVTDRWSFDLWIAGVLVLSGRRLVKAADMLKPFGFGIGKLVVVDWDGTGAEPGRSELPAGECRLLIYEA